MMHAKRIAQTHERGGDPVAKRRRLNPEREDPVGNVRLSTQLIPPAVDAFGRDAINLAPLLGDVVQVIHKNEAKDATPHLFYSWTIETWRGQRNTCPLCRGEIKLLSKDTPAIKSLEDDKEAFVKAQLKGRFSLEDTILHKAARQNMPTLFKLFVHQEEGLSLLLDKNAEGKTPLELLSQDQFESFFSELCQGLGSACFTVVQDTADKKWIEYDDGHLIRLPFPKTVSEGGADRCRLGDQTIVILGHLNDKVLSYNQVTNQMAICEVKKISESVIEPYLRAYSNPSGVLSVINTGVDRRERLFDPQTLFSSEKALERRQSFRFIELQLESSMSKLYIPLSESFNLGRNWNLFDITNGLSRDHAIITIDAENQIQIQDRGSLLGTWLSVPSVHSEEFQDDVIQSPVLLNPELRKNRCLRKEHHILFDETGKNVAVNSGEFVQIEAVKEIGDILEIKTCESKIHCLCSGDNGVTNVTLFSRVATDRGSQITDKDKFYLGEYLVTICSISPLFNLESPVEIQRYMSDVLQVVSELPPHNSLALERSVSTQIAASLAPQEQDVPLSDVLIPADLIYERFATIGPAKMFDRIVIEGLRDGHALIHFNKETRRFTIQPGTGDVWIKGAASSWHKLGGLHELGYIEELRFNPPPGGI